MVKKLFIFGVFINFLIILNGCSTLDDELNQKQKNRHESREKSFHKELSKPEYQYQGKGKPKTLLKPENTLSSKNKPY